LVTLPIPKVRPATREQLSRLVDVLQYARRPVLLHDDRGLGRTALAAAVWRLLEGQSLDQAITEFNAQSGHFGPLDCSPQAVVVLSYREWLAASGLSHRPEVFVRWVNSVYTPAAATHLLIDTQNAPRMVARESAKPSTIR
jgi:MoxR-like ATPase